MHKRQCNEVYTSVLGDDKTKRENLNCEKSKWWKEWESCSQLVWGGGNNDNNDDNTIQMIWGGW